MIFSFLNNIQCKGTPYLAKKIAIEVEDKWRVWQREEEMTGGGENGVKEAAG